MEEMELELRSHSILLEAIQEGIILPSEIPGALTASRESTAMLGFVRQKYDRVRGALMEEELARSSGVELEEVVSYKH